MGLVRTVSIVSENDLRFAEKEDTSANEGFQQLDVIDEHILIYT